MALSTQFDEPLLIVPSDNRKDKVMKTSAGAGRWITPDCKAASAPVAQRYGDVRAFTETLGEPLSPEDCCLQSMPDASPTKWHLAHTTWFFETFLLENLPGYRVFDPAFRILFNSYYNGVGEQFPRPQRGVLSRPSLADVLYYRQYVDEALLKWLDAGEVPPRARHVLEVGLNHEQQHQELILTDIKHALAQNPLRPVYREQEASFAGQDDGGDQGPEASSDLVTESCADSRTWEDFDAGVYEIGHAGNGFAYDNESPRHRAFVESFSLAADVITCGEWLAFMDDGGYRDPRLWLSLGWSNVQEQNWQTPLYWFWQDDAWWQFTLAGPLLLDPDAPVCHVSYFEADAFARWSGARLPTEVEWEIATDRASSGGHFVDTLLRDGRALHPVCDSSDEVQRDTNLSNLFGNVWEWTASPYTPYPGYQPLAGALGEYNGKFMSQQYVLRGGSVATHSTHIRATYRNFFPPETRWQFSGVRLAR